MRATVTGQPVELMTTEGAHKLFSSDAYGCPHCGHEIALPNGKPVREHFEADYAAMREALSRTAAVVQYWPSLNEKAAFEKKKG